VEKYCGRCRTLKPTAEFSRSSRSRDGCHSYCKPCAISANRERAARRAADIAALDIDALAKQCVRCEAVKLLADFYRSRLARDGRANICKPCSSDKQREHSAAVKADPERLSQAVAQRAEKGREYRSRPDFLPRKLANNAKWQAANPEKYKDSLKTSAHMHRARQAGALIIERVRYAEVIRRGNGTCGICKGPVEPGQESLDHIIPLSKGGNHTYENCQLACLPCNVLKGANDVWVGWADEFDEMPTSMPIPAAGAA